MIIIDGDLVKVEEKGKLSSEYNIGTPEAFKVLSDLWLRSGWDTKYVYSFTWMGRPIIQFPEDLIRLQEIIYTIKPDIIIETGIAHGGGLVFYASLCRAMKKGKVIGIDIEIRSHNRKAIETHELFEYITLIEGNSISKDTIEKVTANVEQDSIVMVFLDSNHTKDHVLSELKAYSEFVSEGSYIIAMDGIMSNLKGVPRSRIDWDINNPKAAAEEFVNENSNFVFEEPEFKFNEGLVKERVTYWPGAFIKRINKNQI
ncbi:MAG: CmcI family methyltransferase [Ignavibacteriaceae bacterium]